MEKSFEMEMQIQIVYDVEAKVWVGVCSKIGLALESNSVEKLLQRIAVAVPELMNLNGMLSSEIALDFEESKGDSFLTAVDMFSPDFMEDGRPDQVQSAKERTAYAANLKRKGEKIGQDKLILLIQRLQKEGRNEDAQRVISDPAYREKLLAEEKNKTTKYNIELELYNHDEEENNKTFFNRQMAEIQGEVHRIFSTTGKLDQIRNDKDYRGEPQVIRRLFDKIKRDPKNTKCIAEIQKAESELFDFLEGNENAPTEEKILAYWDRFLQAYIDESPGEPKSQKMGMRGVLSKYANPELASKEEGAWERATVKKYGKGGKNMDINNMDIEKATKHAFELVSDTSLDNLMYAGEDFAGLYVGLESKYEMDSTDFFNIFAHAYQLGFLYGRKAEKEGWEPRPLEEVDEKP